MIEDLNTEIQKIKTTLAPFKAFIKRRAQGHIPYDYLVPSGPYQEHWDWDAFFMGVALAADIPSEAIYLRNWALNYIINARSTGKVAGCLTAKGYDERLNHMKPFLAQGAYLAGKFLKDYRWLKKHWTKMKKIVLYREKHLWNKKYDLGVWYDSMESGADNNIACLDYPKASVVATDLNTLVYREYKAMNLLADILAKRKDAKKFKNRADTIKKNFNKYLWNEKDGIYYNIFSQTGEHIKKISYNSLIPLFGKMANQKQADTIIKNYVLKPNHLWSEFGIRTLSKSDPDFNNRNIIKPYSNWQGPVWPIANYMFMQGLLNYGYQKEAIVVAQRISNLVLDDIKTRGGMHENYDAETGKPLAADNFVSWNILVYNMLDEAINKSNPFEI